MCSKVRPYLEDFSNDLLLCMEARLEVLHVELEQVEGRRSRLAEHGREPDVGTDVRVQLHPERHGSQFACNQSIQFISGFHHFRTLVGLRDPAGCIMRIHGIAHASVVVTFGKNWPFFRQ